LLPNSEKLPFCFFHFLSRKKWKMRKNMFFQLLFARSLDLPSDNVTLLKKDSRHLFLYTWTNFFL
jgi:hypothetical protein